MKRSEIVLAAMAAGGSEARYSPVQLQKLLFLIDREIPEHVGGPHFRFKPYYYGPFDEEVYAEIFALAHSGFVNVDTTKRHCLFLLTDSGNTLGAHIVTGLAAPVSRYLEETSAWVCALSFRQLLTAIYRDFPDMAIHSPLPQFAHQPKPSARFLILPSLFNSMERTENLEETRDETADAWQDMILDAEAISGDWAFIGEDLRRAIEDYEPEQPYES